MQRAYSEGTTPMEYNRQLADYYRQQIASLQGQPRSTPVSTPPAVDEDAIEPVYDIEPAKALDTVQVAQRTSSNASDTFHSTSSIRITAEERRESFESARSTMVGTPDVTDSKPASPMSPNTAAMARVQKAPKRTKSKGGIWKILRRGGSG